MPHPFTALALLIFLVCLGCTPTDDGGGAGSSAGDAGRDGRNGVDRDGDRSDAESDADPDAAPGCDAGSDACPSTGPACNNGLLEALEQCDLGNLNGATCSSLGADGGTLGCTPACRYDTTDCIYPVPPDCGNGQLDGGEVCDGANLDGQTCGDFGFDGGTLECSNACAVRTTACTRCGDDVIEGDEICEDDVFGGATCQGRGFDGGSLTCADGCTRISTDACDACGDGERSADEPCDGPNVSVSCYDEGYARGTMGCTSGCELSFADCEVARVGTCADPVELQLDEPYVIPYETIAASGAAASCDPDWSHTAAFRFTAPSGGQYHIQADNDLFNSVDADIQPALEVRQTTCTGTVLFCEDTQEDWAQVTSTTLNLTTGQVIFIHAGPHEFTEASGPFTIRVMPVD